MDYSKLVTEGRNADSMDLDSMTALEAAALMNRMDAEIPAAVEKALPDIAAVIGKIVEAYRQGGRLVYCGAGTSGRLGVLDASECLPTFGAGADMVTAKIAGGPAALHTAVEGAEDDAGQGRRDLQEIGFCTKDVLIALSASGSAAYCAGALRYARDLGAFTAGVSCVPFPAFADLCGRLITVVIGPEILTGSTRLRAGTATKMVLNMLTTVSMVQYGKDVALIGIFQGAHETKPKQYSMLNQADMKLIFRLNDRKDAETVAESNGLKPLGEFADRILKLKKRKCLVVGNLEDDEGNLESRRFIEVEIANAY